MDANLTVSLAISILLLGYLFFVMVYPERF
ncbi:MAG TPA: K(+)-transporting ATPase subunit F [Lentisphaeria bacterium]|nr:MAG: potassium-transporting ATPase subunit F [Lentisphaerae bacterium GWF2_50_93]HCE43921.1 K(+)-transporting ATPase subunit F [Lentisphaeria bacterium]